MPLITETYYLSLTQDNRGILRLRCSQDDTLRTVNLKLYNNGSIFVIPSGISASVSGVKQNGAIFSKSCTISQDRQSAVLQLSSDITNTDGIIIAEIVLSDGDGGRLGTSNFIIQVEKNPIRAGIIQDTETPIEYVNDFITQIQALTARVNNLITPNGDPSLAEVVDARISSLDGHTYQNLKARIDADIATLNTRKANKSEVYTKSQVDTLLDNVEIDVDDELSDESENPVQNKVINRTISEIKDNLAQIVPGLSAEAKAALLACFENGAWANQNGQAYYDALESALNTGEYPKLEVEYNDRGHIVFTSDDLDTLKNYLTVKYYENSESAGAVISASQYTLSGTLSAGTNVISVSYNNVVSSFAVEAEPIIVPTGYTRHDYIKTKDNFSGASTGFPIGGSIKASLGANLNTLSFYSQLYVEPGSDAGSGGAVFGGRTEQGSTSSVAIYYSELKQWLGAHVHGTDPNVTPPGVIEKNTVTPISLQNGTSSPSVLSAGGKSYDIPWTNNNIVNTDLCLLSNARSSDTTQYMKKKLRVGNIDIRNVNDERIHYLIPSVRTVDNVMGWYDGVTGTFYTASTVKYATIGNSSCAYTEGDW